MSRTIKNPFERKQKGILNLNYLKQVAFAVMAVLSLPIACTKNPPEEPVVSIIMTTLAAEVSFYIEVGLGTDNLVIDWRDGEGSKTYASSYASSYCYLNVYHNYSSASEHNITITGDNIEVLYCGGNQLTSLDVSRNAALTYLRCDNNQLTTLGVNHNTALKELYCLDNQLTTLDVSRNTALTYLDCRWNQLTTLDISSKTPFTHLYCNGNLLTTSALNDLFISLRDAPHSFTKQGPIDYPFWIYINDNPGTDNCDVSIAQAKGWRVYPYDSQR